MGGKHIPLNARHPVPFSPIPPRPSAVTMAATAARGVVGKSLSVPPDDHPVLGAYWGLGGWGESWTRLRSNGLICFAFGGGTRKNTTLRRPPFSQTEPMAAMTTPPPLLPSPSPPNVLCITDPTRSADQKYSNTMRRPAEDRKGEKATPGRLAATGGQFATLAARQQHILMSN
ncbi:uncharacterized protein CLUP02_13483 [Colletotrichum lupini]|uniref:Uncharacterized protein n=1 Tax=Colletotrichum lupini TaxID=145971 RepID=A0A9Q8T470_9PEZI|nr:uncharacterized protein CLUP02_13483 [Colletotrichum lupini]UQC87962.1 hypothetical protein CLUP02_13483 [Colletotrichum lupini]